MLVRVLALVSTLVVAPILAFGQEQTVLINGPQGVLPTPQTWFDVNKATIKSFADAKALINATLGSTVLDNGGTVIIHVLRWKDDTVVEKINWYVYHNGVSSQEEFTGLRIFGQHKVSLLFVHLNAKAATDQEVKRYNAVTAEFNDLFQRLGLGDARSGRRAELLKCIAGEPSISTGTPANAQMKCASAYTNQPDNDAALAQQKETYVTNNAVRIGARIVLQPDLIDGDTCPGALIANASLILLKKYCVAAGYLNVAYRVVSTPKLPAAIADLAKLLQPQAGQRSDELKVDTVALWGGEEMNIISVPSDIKVTPIKGETQLDPRTFDNEGRYFWDISVALPIRSLKDTEYDQTAQSFTAKKIERQSLYAVFNVFPIKIDTKSTSNWRLTPALLIGSGIEKKPLNRLLFAGAIGIGKIQFFVGTAMTKKQFPKPDGTLGDPVYRTNLTYGLNVPIRQVLGKLKAPK